MFIDAEYFDTMPKYSDFKFWFRPNCDGGYTVLGSNSTYITDAVEDENFELDFGLSDMNSTLSEEILSDWTMYKSRPEYALMHIDMVFSYDLSDETADDVYDRLLAGSVLMMAERKGDDPDKRKSGILAGLRWLHSTDFYKAPSSTRYHDSCEKGLLIHSLHVVQRVVDLRKADPFRLQVTIEDAIFSALVHDWCKVGLYEVYTKNIKDEVTGVWHTEKAYRHNDDRDVCLGHGATSMYVAAKFFPFSLEVASAIRWHMGRYAVSDFEIAELGQANRQYPLVLLLQFADQLSIVNY